MRAAVMCKCEFSKVVLNVIDISTVIIHSIIRGSAISQSSAYLFQCVCYLPYILMLQQSGLTWKGTLGERELATQTILFNIESMCFTLLPLGFGIASSIRVGQFLGARSSIGPRSVVSTALVTLCK
ncbi:unnamed protein product [Schistosoma mattheei]|uniref:Uncharacterized protein n=1 Tax=Schistosoma mattheei TaxID=31246 RepID=A0A183P7S6_9TREM|nr:unnamed protein product [Schistosoma mattheei]